MTAPDFNEVVLVHLDAAFNLAMWLLRDTHAAEDVVQDAMLRALTYFRSYKGGDARAWVFQIVRNAAFEYLRARKAGMVVPLETLHSNDDRDSTSRDQTNDIPELIDPDDGPEAAWMKEKNRTDIERAIDTLPLELRECIVLREFEELSYKDIAQITAAPIGTVMSRLWRARQLLLQTLVAEGD